MFPPSSLEKNCINSDSCSSSRNNSPNRFSVGITPLGDENQQIRIQLAVHKYNGTIGSSFNNRCSFMSPVRHSFLKNSLKVRNYEGDHEGTTKTDKRNGNQYEGVGSFPTVHLKKNAVRYRPIKRFHDVKIPCPEIPVNRFLSHLPEVSPDLKSSTRSVLDVLEDLSGNKIHSKDDVGGKPKPRGLGGDYLLNPNAVFKPLFVQKPKLNTVLTRDNTTQTLSPVSIETPSPQSSASSQVRNGTSDPKAELRRKLAKQNNEIFASLSSSISSAFCLKRKIDKVTPSKDDGQPGEGSVLKKTKTVDHNSRQINENGTAKSPGTPTTNSRESLKLNRKNKLTDVNSVSPNKDRLTTIFLDTRNTSPKAQVFHPNASTEKKSLENGSHGCPKETSGEPAEKTPSPLVNGKGKDESSQDLVNFSSSGKSGLCAVDNKQEVEQSDKTGLSFVGSPLSTVAKDTPKAIPPILQVDANAAVNINFGSPKAPTGSISNSSETFQKSGNDSEKKDDKNTNDASKGFVFGGSSDKPNFGSFKFGAGENTPSAQNKTFTDFKPNAPETVSTSNPVATISTAQFSSAATSSATAPPLQTSTFQFGVSSPQNTGASSGATTFAFGHTPLSTQQKSPNADGKHETSSTVPTSSSCATNSIQSTGPVAFTFGQRSNVGGTAADAKTNDQSSTTHPTQSKAVNFIDAFNKNSPSSTETARPAFAPPQKSDASVTSAGPTAVVQQQNAKAFPFTFGQKSDAGRNEGQPDSAQDQKSANLFSNAQNPLTQQPTQTSAAATPPTALTQPSITQMNQTFAQTASQPTVTSPATFTQNSTTPFGTKPEAPASSSGFNSTSPLFPNKTLSFGSSINTFAKTTTQTTTAFATSTTTAPAFSFAAHTTTTTTTTTTCSISTFGASTTHSPPTFGSSPTSQSISLFSTSPNTQTATPFSASTSHSTSAFIASPTTQPPPAFGVSSASQSTPALQSPNKQSVVPSFGTTSTTQSTSTFPGPSSQPAPPFGTSAPTPTTFAAPAGFGLSSSHPTPVFGAPTSTQSTMTFQPTTTQNTTFGSSPGFSTAPSSAPTSAPAFAPSPSLDKPAASLAPTPNIFSSNPSPAFSPSTAFPSTQNTLFAQKPTAEAAMFGQSKLQTSGFPPAPQPFGCQNKFSFGLSTSTTSPPTTTAPMLFSFGGSSAGNAFSAGSSSSASSNTPTPFAFRTSANEPFKFGASATTVAATGATTTTTAATKEGGGFGGAGSGTFSSPPVGEQKPGNTQTSSAGTGFNFRTTPSPSLFSFGGSTSSGSSGSSFNFGAGTSGVGFGKGASPGGGVAGSFNIGSSGSSGSNFNFGTPTGGISFGQGSSPGAPFAVPGTFNIGSGSSQSRPRASSRPRRRP